LFLNLPKDPENSFLVQHIQKLDKVLVDLDKAFQSKDLLAKSLENMEMLSKLRLESKLKSTLKQV
jgi:hypothetical protein